MNRDENIFDLASKIYADMIKAREKGLRDQLANTAADDARDSMKLAQVFVAEFERSYPTRF